MSSKYLQNRKKQQFFRIMQLQSSEIDG